MSNPSLADFKRLLSTLLLRNVMTDFSRDINTDLLFEKIVIHQWILIKLHLMWDVLTDGV